MERKINWLHLSDLHMGHGQQSILLPRVEKELFVDLGKIYNHIGAIDVVFFTGDLSQSGAKEEFENLTSFLNEMWAIFKKQGSAPKLIAIPGNHDLDRTAVKTITARALTSYSQSESARDEFWKDIAKGEDYKEMIDACFANFTNWYKNVNLPKPELIHGIIPGDISATLDINDVKLNIMGFNTAFLEIGNDDYLGKLALHPDQFLALRGGDPFKWYESGDLNLLLTHHDSIWYEKNALDYYRDELNAPGTYFAHLCGHLHTASASERNEIGSARQRVQLAPSLFGLEKTASGLNRIHGYYAGSFSFDGPEMRERFYPRAMQQKNAGSFKIGIDQMFDLNMELYSEIKHKITERKEIEELPSEEKEDIPEENPKKWLDEIEKEDILGQDKQRNLEKNLESIPRSNYSLLAQHEHIRVLEQRTFVKHLVSKRLCWLITDWGYGEEGFIGSIYHELDIMDNRHNFVINGEDAQTLEELYSSFEEQAGISFINFCNMINGLDNHLLIFNQINPSLYQAPDRYEKLMRLVETVQDYCPSSYIILTCREVPKHHRDSDIVRILPLDTPQVRSYVEHHADREDILDRPEDFSKLIDITDGLPSHIDRFLENLKLASIEDILEEGAIELADTEKINKPLEQTLRSLSTSIDRMLSQSYRLLKILTVLSRGEVLSNLKRFGSGDNILLEHVRHLESISLLVIFTTSRVVSQVSDNSEPQQIKLLSVPRQIRDYVNMLMTDAEKEGILKDACSMYFGSKWRQGIIRNFQNSMFGEKDKYLNLDNCKVVIINMLGISISNGDEVMIERMGNLAVNYCQQVYDLKDYRNAQLAAEEFYQLLKNTGLSRVNATINKILGRSLRMNGFYDRSITVLNEAYENQEFAYSNTEKKAILISLGYAYMRRDVDKALEVADQILKIEPRNMAAQYIIARVTLEGDQLLKKLRFLEREAKIQNVQEVVNNISLYLSSNFLEKEERIKRYNKLVATSKDAYNTIRAIVAKAQDLLEDGQAVFTRDDLVLLNKAYSYLYKQRMMDLFENCHEVLWQLSRRMDSLADQLNLFRHSSFFWRIAGEEKIEKKYFEELSSRDINITNLQTVGKSTANTHYYIRRKLELMKTTRLLENN